MATYIILLFAVVLLCIGAGKNKKRQVICSAIILGIMATMCALRGINCGTDNINYLQIFTQKEYSSLEIGFIASYYIFPNFQLWLSAFAIATYSILFFQLKKETLYMCMGVLIFMISTSKFFPESFNVIRQSLAASLILWSFISWQHSKKSQAFLGILTAMLFHTSSIIALPFFLLKKIKFPYWICAVGVILTVILGMRHIINETLQLFVIGATEYNSNDNLTDIANKYSSYGYNESEANAKGMLVNTFPISAMVLITYPWSKEAKEKFGFYYNIFFIATIIGNIFIPAMQYGFRLVFSIQIVQVLVLPLAYQYSKKVWRQLIICYLAVLSIIYLYYIYLLPISGIRSIVPYRFMDDLQVVINALIGQ